MPMYELFVVACVGAQLCQYIFAPIAYPTITHCNIAASIIAGEVRGRHQPGLPLSYRHECTQKHPIGPVAGPMPAAHILSHPGAFRADLHPGAGSRNGS